MNLLGLLSRSTRFRICASASSPGYRPLHLPVGYLHSTTRFKFKVVVRHNSSTQATENANVSHSQFIANADASSKWSKRTGHGSLNAPPGQEGEFDNIVEGKGKLLPTSSHLFKLILPLGPLTASKQDGTHYSNIKPPPPTVILLHPSQPLSHVARLVLGALAPAMPTISFRSTSATGTPFQWSDSTDLGDFIKDASRSAKFSIYITYPAPSDGGEPHEAIIDIKVPTFEDRTHYLQRRLTFVTQRLEDMEALKKAFDREAHAGARRMALGGLGALIVYWGAVARLTFWDYGWDVMEPITYLSGLSTVVCGYLWFLYQGREVSYASVLDRSVSARREALYKSRGLDVDAWLELVAEKRRLKGEIGRIAEDYDEEAEGKRGGDGEGDDTQNELRQEVKEIKTKSSVAEKDGEGDADKADRAERSAKADEGEQEPDYDVKRVDRAERHSKE
ncbi:hypothetical protein HWV62_41344 [Athelia sp. TMB]|nr:hypothetical protein HWV62_41344 [Athelia sp. TMB]